MDRDEVHIPRWQDASHRIAALRPRWPIKVWHCASAMPVGMSHGINHFLCNTRCRTASLCTDNEVRESVFRVSLS